jgi:hypothetical protein
MPTAVAPRARAFRTPVPRRTPPSVAVQPMHMLPLFQHCGWLTHGFTFCISG